MLLKITANRTERSVDNRAMLSGYSARGGVITPQINESCCEGAQS